MSRSRHRRITAGIALSGVLIWSWALPEVFAEKQPAPADPAPSDPAPADPAPADPAPADPAPPVPPPPAPAETPTADGTPDGGDAGQNAGQPDGDGQGGVLSDEELLQQALEDLDSEIIVVTGSRIKHSSAVAPAPVTVLDAEDALLSGKTDIVDLVQKVPGLINSINTAQTSDQQGIEGDGDAGSSVGVATLNLRSLGTKRTLVLVDGRRHVGGRAGDTAVDINTIPVALLERVEVLTGGASAVYGADAVTGVINFITRRDMQGSDARVQFDINDNGDGARFYASAAAGSKFADDRGSAMIAIEYRRQSQFACGDAAFCRGFGVYDDQGNPAAADDENVPPRIFGPHSTFAISSAMGRIGIDFDGDGNPDGAAPDGFFLDTNGDGVNDVGQTPLGIEGFGDWVVDNGGLRLFRPGQIASFANQFGGDGIASGPFDFQTLIPEQDSVVANALVRYKVVDGVDFFADSKYVYSKNIFRDQVTGFNDLLTVTLENPFIPTELRTALDSAIAANPDLADNTTLFITRDFLDLGDNISENERRTFRLVTGFEGELKNGISYELSFNYGRTDQEVFNLDSRIEDRFFAAIDVVTDPDGNPICRSELNPEAPPPPTSPFPFVEPGFRTFSPGDGQCKPLNLFGFGAPSQEAIDFVTADIVSNSAIEQQVVHASFIGDSDAVNFALPAGPIDFAAGGEYRREASRFRPSSFEQAGIVFDGTTTSGLEGDYDVWEGFGELSVPIVSKKPGAEALNLDSAIRVADYSTVGSSVSWKLGTSWTPVSDVRVRGGYSVAVRAPNVGELFQAETTAFFRPIDPCDAAEISTAPDPAVRAANCAADGISGEFTDPLTGRFAGVRSGNADLAEETATTYTVGAVVTPRHVPGLIVAFDYFDISLDDAIDEIDDQDIVNNCYDDPGGIDNQFCDLFARNRDPASPTFLGFNFLRVSQLNIGKKQVAGVDFEATYSLDLARLRAEKWGDVLFRLYGTWIRKLDDTPNQDDPDFINPELREIRRPRWVVNSGARWNWNKLTVNYGMTFMSQQALDDVEIETAEESFVNPFAGRKYIHDISASYQILPELSVYGGMNNITDQNPFLTSTSFPVSPVGRMVFLGVNSSL